MFLNQTMFRRRRFRERSRDGCDCRKSDMGPDGCSYTEMEYRYALDTEKPCLAFVHADPTSLPVSKAEQSDEGRRRLADFRQTIQQRLYKSWKTPADLGSVVSRSLIRLIKTNPGTGWVRADSGPDEASMHEIIRLRHRVEELEALLDRAATQAPAGSEQLAQGDDLHEIFCEDHSNIGRQSRHLSVNVSWNDLFALAAPRMIDEASETTLRYAIADGVERSLGKSPGRRVVPTMESLGTVLVQLRALGLIAKSDRRRSLKDGATYWSLTPYGDSVMTRLLAVSRPQPARTPSASGDTPPKDADEPPKTQL